MIIKDDCIEVGYVHKPHGIKGEVILVFIDGFKETFEEIDYLLVEVDGGLVPFFFGDDGFRPRNGESAICKFDFVDSQAKAKEITGCKVYLLDEWAIGSERREADSVLIGMRAFDAKSGDLGTVSRVDDFSGNLVITVDHPNAEILIPLSDGIITLIDEEKREIHLDCPNGLIEIYLEQ